MPSRKESQIVSNSLNLKKDINSNYKIQMSYNKEILHWFLKRRPLWVTITFSLKSFSIFINKNYILKNKKMVVKNWVKNIIIIIIKMTTNKCCICLEKENWPAFIHCHFCNEGMICCYCYDEYTNMIGNNYIKCPICNNFLISEIKRTIIIDALLYSYGIRNKNNLIKRWFYNYLSTDEFKLMGQTVPF